MSAPRIEIDLSKIRHNARALTGRLKRRGVSVTAVTKAVCGDPYIAQAMLDGGAIGLADTKVRNVRRLRRAGMICPITLIRTPMLSEVDQVVRSCDMSLNTELSVIKALAAQARQAKRVHEIILMVEMGDGREGILPKNVPGIALQVCDTPGVALKGIGANFACLSAAAPDDTVMKSLTVLAYQVEAFCGTTLEILSGGNSANLPWALGAAPLGRVNNLRLGEAILLGVDPISKLPIAGLHGDAFHLVAEVIETKSKPASAAGHSSAGQINRHDARLGQRVILALGRQDVDVSGLGMPHGVTLVGATGDHLVVEQSQPKSRVGSELTFEMDYNAVMRAMNAPDIAKRMLHETQPPNPAARNNLGPRLALV